MTLVVFDGVTDCAWGVSVESLLLLLCGDIGAEEPFVTTWFIIVLWVLGRLAGIAAGFVRETVVLVCELLLGLPGLVVGGGGVMSG